VIPPDRRSARPEPSSIVVGSRALRGFADGLVSVLLAGYLTRLGFAPLEVGAIVSATLLGSAALTILVGVASPRLEGRRVLLLASVLMLATGLGFAGLQAFWPLLVVALLGTLNPSSGDVSVFLPAEQALLADASSATDRPRVFAWYNVAGALAGALGALASAAPAAFARRSGIDVLDAERSAFLFYGAIGVGVAALYWRLPRPKRPGPSAFAPPLARSRRVVLHLAALFSLDSFGGGFVVQSVLVLWLHRRFGLSVESTGAIFFAAGLVSALSQLVSPRVAARLGLVRTMVYTHLPASVLLIAAGVVPSAGAAVGLLLLRAALSQMDVPARQSYVMALVPAEERAAAASFTNVPRSLAAALPPFLTGLMLERSSFGWPLVCAGAIKATYDLLLLAQFRAVHPPEQA
jgi:MFS family permease